MNEEDNKTLWCGNLSEQVTEDLLYELFLQAGPLEKVRIPRDRDGRQKNFAFITYCHDVSVPYAISLLRGTALFNKTLTLQCRARMATLPPPIRAVLSEPVLDLNSHPNVLKQFADMTERLQPDDYKAIHMPRAQNSNDKLVLASLQGNWSHRHHPYMAKEKGRDEFRPRDHNNYKSNARGKNTTSWRDKRNYNKNGGYHRRD